MSKCSYCNKDSAQNKITLSMELRKALGYTPLELEKQYEAIQEHYRQQQLLHPGAHR